MILLDTHAWLWWTAGGGRLSEQQSAAIDGTLSGGQRLLVSAVSAWEIGLLASGGRIDLGSSVEDWVRRELADPALHVVPLTWELAAASTRMPGTFHRDPADRFLVATARALGVPLVTADRRIRAYPHVESV